MLTLIRTAMCVFFCARKPHVHMQQQRIGFYTREALATAQATKPHVATQRSTIGFILREALVHASKQQPHVAARTSKKFF